MSQIAQQDQGWQVSGDMTAERVNALLAESAGMTLSDRSVVDLSAVTDVDTASISLLFEWLRRANARNGKLSFSNLPENLTSLAELYGVLELIPQSSH